MLQSAIKICLQQDTISGFSYSFSKALLEKLKKLREEDKLFKEGKLTLLAYSISTHLDEQINPMKKALQDMSDISGFEALIQVAEEFLTIFENAPINLDTSLYALGFSPRVWNGLVELKIKTISDLTNTPSSQLLKQRSFGKTCLQEVRNILKANGLFLKNEGLKTPIENLHLSTRTRWVLEPLNVKTLEDIIKCPRSAFNNIKFGPTALRELESFLSKLGFIESFQE